MLRRITKKEVIKTAKVFIDGHVFETGKSKWHASLNHFDGHNNQYGDVYESSTGILYVWTPSQWGNMHTWIIMDASQILDSYGDYLSDEEADYLIKKGQVSVE